MADVNANIGVQIDTSDALAQLKNLQRQISQFHTSVAKSSSVAAAAQKSLQQNLVNSINSIGAFTAELRTVKTSAESFTHSLENNKFSMREYFRYAGASTKTFGKLFKSEFDTIGKVADDRVKKLQTQYIKLGRDANGAMKALAVMPNELDYSKTSTQLQVAAQKQAIFNQLLKQGSTNLLNFGKNTQWAGRQLMVGFTIPLGVLGMKAGQTFMDMEKAALKFKKVYGDLLTSPEETKAALDGITELGKQYTKYGVAVADTVALSADAAAAGFQGLDLQRQTAQATRLSVLGQIESQQALETTIALQNAFKMSSEDLAGSIDFLNAVENQTVTSLDDITTAIPKVAPVIQQLGGDVKDLAFFITAMKEGGINASEGANALKSGLAALINPTSKATAMLAGLGININNIVESNKGDLKATVVGFAEALDTLDPLSRARAIEQMFGKFQFARLSTLFQNVTKDGTQAGRVLKLAGTSIQDLAALSEKELGMTASSPMNQFKKAVEDLKVALIPVGETFLKAVTPIVEFFGNILSKFSGLSDNTKKIITIITIALAGVGPVLLMTFGLLANGVANIIKLFGTLRNGYLKLTGQSTMLGEQTQYMTTEQLEAAAAAHSLNQSHATLKQTFDVEKASLDQLIASYQAATRASARFAAANPGSMLPARGGKKPKKYANGKPYIVGGTGNKDSEAAMLTPGETVIPADMSKKYGSLINGIIADNIPGRKTGVEAEVTRAPSISELKKDAGLFAAPDAIASQTKKMTWSTLLAELEAVDKAAKEFNLTLSDEEKLTEQQVTNMKQVTAGHVKPDTTTVDMGNGAQMEIKKWAADNLAPELGPNTFMNTLNRSAEGLSEFNDVQIAKAAEKLGLTFAEVEAELNALKADIQPTTKRGQQVFREVADFYAQPRQELTPTGKPKKESKKMRGRRWQATATREILDARLADDGPKSYYKTVARGAYSPAKDAKAAEQTYRAAKKVYAKFLKVPEETADKALSRLRTFLGISSPSKKTKKIGEQMAEGLEVGMKKRKAKVTKVAQDLAVGAVTEMDTAVTKQRRSSYRPQGPAPIGPEVPAGATMLPITTPLTRREKVTNTAKTMYGKAASKLGGIRGMGVSSGLMMGAQFIPGKAGEVASQVSGLALAAQAGAEAFKILPGPAKLVAAGFLATVGAVKLANAYEEKQRRKIEGLGDTAVLTEDKLKTLGDAFGIVAKSLPSEVATDAPSGLIPVASGERTQINALRQNADFQTNYKDSIDGLKAAKAGEAKMVLESLALQLKGRGFASEQIKIIIKALQEESGKTKLKLDFENIGVASKEKIEKNVDDISKYLTDYLNKNKDKRFSFDDMYNPGQFGEITKVTSFQGSDVAIVETRKVKEIDAAAKSAIGILKGLDAQFQNGEISSKDFNSQISTMIEKIRAIPNGGGMVLLNSMLGQLGPKAVAAANGIKGVSTQYKVLLALSSGIINADDPILAKLKTATDPKTLGRLQAALSKKLKNFYSVIDFANQQAAEDFQESADTVATETAEKFNFGKYIQGMLLESKNQVIAFQKLKKAGIDAAFAMELVGNADIAAAVANGELTDKIKEQMGWIKGRQDQLEEYQKAIEEGKKTEADRQKEILAIEEARFSLEEEIIKSKYSTYIYETNEALRNQQYELELVNRQIKTQEENMAALVDPKQKRIEEISYQLESISFKEDAINEKYDKQSELLSTITKMNQDLYSIQKKRVSLADALSSGDISSAASIIMDMRAEEASVQATTQQEVLDAAREQELAALGRLDLEKESKKLEFDILTIQRNQSTALEDQAKTIQKIIDNLTNNLSDYEEAAADEVYAVSERLSQAFGRTKSQIQSAMSMIDLANTAGFDMNSKTLITNILDAAIGKANILKKLMAEASGVDTRTPAEVAVDEADQATKDAEKAAADAEAAADAAEKAVKEMEDYLKSIGIKTPEPPIVGESKYIGSMMYTWDGKNWVEASSYKAPAADSRNAPGSNAETPVTTPEIKVPHGAAPDVEDMPKIVYPDTPAATTPTGPSKDTSATPEETARERGNVSGGVAAAVETVIDLSNGFFDGLNSMPALDIPSLNIDYDLLASYDWASIIGFSKGGLVPQYLAKGGFSRGTDTIPAMLTPGEFVVNRRAAAGLGVNNLNAMNSGQLPSSSVYNYKVDVTLNGSDMNPNDVANAVLTKIKQLESRNVRRQGI